ncbi:hypothetical protein GI582_26005 [Sulfitobacter sp. BDSS02]|nr:hypothetical protein [Sulfitobacter sp. BDSS02]MBR9852869.1 hypothetical protein [Paracoccaceae bacterium]
MNQNTDFVIADAVFSTFPEMSVSALRVQIDRQTALKAVNDNLEAEMPELIERLHDAEPLTQMSEIACWRDAYGKLGVKPSKFPSSIEALLRRAKKNGLGEIGIPAVDLYNRISVKHRAPLGAYDAAKLRPTEGLQLRHAFPDADVFSPLGGKPESFPLNPDLIVYAQASEVLCWGFNTRDSTITAVDENTSEIIFFSEATKPDGAMRGQAALSEIADLFSTSGGKVSDIVSFSANRANGRV